MPTYQYACTACGERLEAVQSFSDAPLSECPACAGALRKVFSAVGVVFKGSGFYKTDSRSGGASAGKGESTADANGTGNGSGKGSSNGKGSGKGEAAGSGGDSSSTSGSGKPAPAPAAAGSSSSTPAGKTA